MSSLYDRYVEFIKKQLDKDELVFKSDPDYQYMLEHSPRSFGPIAVEYLPLIQKEFNTTPEEIVRFTTLNDSFGKPEVVNFEIIPPCSLTSLRYVYHAHLALNHMKKLNLKNVNVVEIGGGYGGLCMAIHTYAPTFGINIERYNIIDLEIPGKLQRRVLDMKGYSDVKLYDAKNFGSELENDVFLISAYAFAEIDTALQKQYIDILFPKVTHGFIVWNCIPVYDIGKNTHVEDERPMTGNGNRFVYF